MGFASTDVIPGNQAFRTMAGIFTSLEESAAPVINSFNHSFRDRHSRHIVKGDGAKDNRRENKPASSIEESSTPTGKVLVHRRDERQTIRDIELAGGKWKAKINLWEGGDSGTQVGGHIISQLVRDNNWQEDSFVVVNRQPSRIFKNLQNLFCLLNSIRRASKEDKCVIGVLKDRARSIGNERVVETGSKGGVMEETVENICHNNEEIKGTKGSPDEAYFSN